MTPNELAEMFEYKNGRLYWKIAPRNNPKMLGKAAGTMHPRGYTRICIGNKFYLMHRLIFLMINGYMPMVVDHIDGDTSNNAIENLRDATFSQNQFNSKVPKNNKSGVKGVCWFNASKKWRVQITANKVKHFFGYFDDLELASLVATEARDRLHGKWANHG